MKKYPDIDSWRADLEPWQKRMFDEVRGIILTNVPDVEESIKYGGVPFYTRKGYLFYFALHKKKYFVLGFCEGFKMSDEAGILRADSGQTQVKHWILDPDSSLERKLLVQYIHEAVLINEHLESLRKKTGK